jgi:hypothetical protein
MGIGRTPDTVGLQEFFITEIETEVIGHEVRVMCGVKRCGEIHWLYSCVMPSDLMLLALHKITRAAEMAYNQSQLEDWKRSSPTH